jgi:hypothetical protein
MTEAVLLFINNSKCPKSIFVDFGRKSTNTGIPPANFTILIISGTVYGDIITSFLLFDTVDLTNKNMPDLALPIGIKSLLKENSLCIPLMNTDL